MIQSDNSYDLFVEFQTLFFKGICCQLMVTLTPLHRLLQPPSTASNVFNAIDTKTIKKTMSYVLEGIYGGQLGKYTFMLENF